MKHLSEEELALYAFDAELVPSHDEIDAHLATCPQCSDSLAFIRSIDEGLRDPDVWEIAESDASAGRQAIREFAAQVAAENEEAERLLESLLENPARLAFVKLVSRRGCVTAGVVRRLLRASADAREREPLDALTFADSAIEVAERLSGYSSAVIHELRAHAWKERANALTALGHYDASLDALDHAEREFARAPGAASGPAIVQYARATIHYYRGELERATELLSASSTTFASLGETDPYMRTRHLMANVTFAKGDVRGARAICEELLGWAEAENDLSWIAHESNSIGRFAMEAGDLSIAFQSFSRSMKAFMDLGRNAEALKPQWGMALVLLASRKPGEALERLRQIHEEFDRRGMVSDEALISLDMMDALHALQRDSDIAAIASEVIQTFTRARMLTAALTAFAYLREAAAHGHVTGHQTGYVRTFLSRLERDPSLRFRPPEQNL